MGNTTIHLAGNLISDILSRARTLLDAGRTEGLLEPHNKARVVMSEAEPGNVMIEVPGGMVPADMIMKLGKKRIFLISS